MTEHSRPSLRDTDSGGPYGSNVARFLADHPGHVLVAGRGGEGYEARRKNGYGHGVGEPVTALTLDELHARMEQAETAKGM